MDLVFPLGTGSNWHDNELRYCLRSVQKHLKGVDKIFIVGHLPSFLKEVIHIPFKDLTAEPAKNSTYKILEACKHPDLSSEFILMNDDFYLTRDYQAESFPWYIKGDLTFHNKGSGMYLSSIANTIRALRMKHQGTLHYDVHAPMRINKRIFQKVLNAYNWDKCSQGMLSRSLYGNSCQLPYQQHQDLIINRKLQTLNVHNVDFFTINDLGINETLTNFLSSYYSGNYSYWETNNQNTP